MKFCEKNRQIERSSVPRSLNINKVSRIFSRFAERFGSRRRLLIPEPNPNQGYKKIYEEPPAKNRDNDKEEAIKTALKTYVAEKMELKFPKKILESAITRSFGLGDPIQIGNFDENTIKDIIRATFGGSPDVWNALPRGARKLGKVNFDSFHDSFVH